MLSSLPVYDNPPVTEVAISVAFPPLAKWKTTHFGLLSQRFSGEYPNTETQSPIPPSVEPPPGALGSIVPLFPFNMDPGYIRCWFLSDPPERMIQVQRDRFITNWRKVTGSEVYPRYQDEIRPRFKREWEKFLAFVAENGIDAPQASKCEVAYINDIPQGSGWDTFKDLPNLFSMWSGKGSDGYLEFPETASISGSFVIPNEDGRLNFSVHHLNRVFDQKAVIQFQMIGSGRPASSSLTDVLACIDRCHEWIVKGFTDLTTTIAHDLWKRRK